MARPHPALIELAVDRPLPKVTDPDEVLESAIEHRMTGLLWHRVESGEISVGLKWKQTLAAHHAFAEEHHRRLWNVLEDVTQRLTDMEIEIATFKGVTAEARWYDRIGDRPCWDLDLLVAPESTYRMGEIIDTIHSEHHLRPSAQALIDSGNLQSLNLRDESGVGIDLHVDLLKYEIPSLQASTIWERTTPYTLPNGSAVRVLDAEMSLIQFLLHANKDRFSYLLQFADVARLLQREQLDWEFIRSFVAREGLDPMIYSSLRTVKDTLEIPGQFPPPPRDLRTALWRLLWRPDVRLLGDRGKLKRRRSQFWIPWMIPGRKPDALRWLVRRVFPPPELLEAFYPGTPRSSYVRRLVTGRLRRMRERHNRIDSMP